MASTSRIVFTLAVPIFGFLTIWLIKRKKLKSFDFQNSNGRSVTSITDNSMKLQPDYSSVVQSRTTTSEKMQLKENSSNLSSACNGVASLSKHIGEENGISSSNGVSSASNGVSSASNGVSSASNGVPSTSNGMTSTSNGVPSASNGLTNGQCRISYAAVLKVNKNVNGTVAGVKTKSKENCTGVAVQPAKSDKNCRQNGLNKQDTRTDQFSNGESSTNSVLERASNETVVNSNGVPIVTTSNGVNQISKSKSKKKNKGKIPEKSNTCSIQPLSNGCVKDNGALVQTDNENTLANSFCDLTLENVSVEVLATQSQEMDLNSCSKDSCEQIASSCNSGLDAQTVTSVAQTPPNVVYVTGVSIEVAEECDIVSSENHCATPESGRSSETLSETAETLRVDVNGHLMFSDDCVATGGQDMLASPEAAYCDSLGSNDSGRGCSELQFSFDSQPCSMTYEFDLRADHCGYLIGKKGQHVNLIKEKTNALIWIRNSLSPFNTDDKRVVSIIAGDEASINEALKLIRKRFPLSKYPDVTLERSDKVLVCPPALRLTLPEGVEFQVVLSATMNAAHFFVQLPTHPSYHALPPFTLSMTSLYTHCHAPVVTAPTVGNIVVAPVSDGWFRAEIMEVFAESETCKLQYLDYGGYQIVPTNTLRQINFEFMQMPFQAIECYLANVTCHEELGWTEESKMAFENLAQGQILSAFVAGVADDGIPCLHLYKVTGATNTFINQALVESGYAKWVSYEQ